MENTIFLAEDKNKRQLSLSLRAPEVADDVSWSILVTSLKFGDVTNLWSVAKRLNCLPIHFIHWKLKYFSNKKSCCLYKKDVANGRWKFFIWAESLSYTCKGWRKSSLFTSGLLSRVSYPRASCAFCFVNLYHTNWRQTNHSIIFH